MRSKLWVGITVVALFSILPFSAEGYGVQPRVMAKNDTKFPVWVTVQDQWKTSNISSGRVEPHSSRVFKAELPVAYVRYEVFDDKGQNKKLCDTKAKVVTNNPDAIGYASIKYEESWGSHCHIVVN